MEPIFMNTENSKMNEQHKFVLVTKIQINISLFKTCQLLHKAKYKKTV